MRMTEIGKSREWKNGACALLLVLVLLTLALVVVQFRLGWDTQLDEVPLLFWALYVPVALGWLGLTIYEIVTPTKSDKGKIRSIDIMLFALGVMHVWQGLIGPTWTSERLLTMTMGIWFLLLGGHNLFLVYKEKRQRTA